MIFFKFVFVNIIFLPTILFAENQYKTKLDLKLKFLVNNGVVLVADDQNILYRYPHNNKKKLIPASVIKLATSLAAIYYLGYDFQYRTDFYLSKNKSLIIRGRGDPLLVSEVWEIITKNISQLPNFPKKLKKLSFDNSLYSKKIRIPGIEYSSNPYDARNGALVVNFNTVYIKKNHDGIIFSAERQTPLTPLARQLGKRLSIGSHRISLPEGSELIYAGELIREFFLKRGVSFHSPNVFSESKKFEDKLIYTHVNKMTISEIISGMMLYSNNFTANQLLLSIGLKRFGGPSSLKKGNLAIREYLFKELKIPISHFDIFEGSGISRKNRLTAEAVLSLLKAFSNDRYLLNISRGVFLKTGTLSGVYSMAGYLNEKLFFVILLNQEKNNRDKILDLLLSTEFTEKIF